MNQYKLKQIKIDNSTFVVREDTPDTHVVRSCFSGEFECLRYLLPKNYEGLIIDAGAYIGASTIALSKLFKAATIVAVEPSDDNFQILKMNCQNLPKIDLIKGALVGSKKKELKLKNRKTGEWGFTIVENPIDCNNAIEFDQKVHSISIADIEKKHGKNTDLLKLDIEGAEKELIENDYETICRIPFIFAELHERIISGCEKAFFRLSERRFIVKDSGEKFLSIAKN